MGNVKLILWDLGGQAELRTIWDKVSILSFSCLNLFIYFIIFTPLF